MSFVTRMGPTGAALREADAETQARARDLLQAAFAPFVEDGEARFTAACWWVTAQA